jgi:hypothetical protein
MKVVLLLVALGAGISTALPVVISPFREIQHLPLLKKGLLTCSISNPGIFTHRQLQT